MADTIFYRHSILLKSILALLFGMYPCLSFNKKSVYVNTLYIVELKQIQLYDCRIFWQQINLPVVNSNLPLVKKT